MTMENKFISNLAPKKGIVSAPSFLLFLIELVFSFMSFLIFYRLSFYIYLILGYYSL